MKSNIIVGILIAALCLCGVSSATADTFSNWVLDGDHYTASNNTYALTMYNATGTHYYNTTTYPFDVLIQAGGSSGAGGSTNNGAGGGAAGGTFVLLNYTTSIGQNITLVVGSKGSAVPADSNSNRGTNSSFDNNIAIRGGYSVTPAGDGESGGSGGAAANTQASGVDHYGGAGIPGQGKNGGDAIYRAGYYVPGPGGGGNSTAGTWANTVVTWDGGAGGDGFNASGFGLPNKIACGGGGGARTQGGFGNAGLAICGGGNGSDDANGASASAATSYGSGGGGGAAYYDGATGGGAAGYDGVVIIRTRIALTADFTSNTTVGYPGACIQFTDLSSGVPDAWSWDFGDSNTSILQNPVNCYSPIGSYNVTLNASSGSLSNITTKSNYINIYPVPVVSFNATPVFGTLPATVNFVDNSTGTNISAWYWDFGDGNTSTVRNATHIYEALGTFNVTLTVKDNVGNTTSDPLQITVENFNAIVYITPTSGQAPLTVSFEEIYIGLMPDSYLWEFGDGFTSTDKNTTHQYTTAGNFTVSHRIVNGSFVKWVNTTNAVWAQAPLVSASFTTDTSSGLIPLTVQFTDTSSAENNTVIDAWDWDFGDGNSSILQNPTHIYNVLGNFTAILTARNITYNSNGTASKNITVLPPTIYASFTSNVSTGSFPLTVAFTDTSTTLGTTINAWSWDFDDGTFSNVQNPVHTFSAYGNFTVTLTARNTTNNINGTASSNIFVETPSGVTRQDLYMSQQYTLTVTFLDANTKSIVQGVIVTDSNGFSSNTTYGVYTHTYDYSAVTIYYKANGYASGSRTYSMTQDRIETILLVPVSASTHNVIYQPTQIEFVLYTSSGNPLSNGHISATPLNFTAPDDWTSTLLGIDSSVNIEGTTVSGYTGTDGTWAAPMLASQQYQIDIAGTYKGSPYSYSITLYPAVSPVQLTIPIGVNAIPTSAANIITYSLSNTSVNSSAQFVTMAYSDTSLSTSELIFWVVNTEGVTVLSESYTGIAANSQSFNRTFAVLGGQSYTYGLSANTSNFEDPWINQSASFNINYHVGLLGQDPGTVELWLALAILVMWAAIGSIYFKHIILIGMPPLYWFMAMYLGWLPLTLYVNITLGVMLTLGVLIYVRYKENMLR